ncbi:mannose-6-phosphate isomerase, class I [Lacticigenium naphthae]|uniref:mannose-6-phosphate isomerase, class I n=1 Tax=Lacticigenium naphthae TaxID=515351 RepID=UPI0004102E43|nr:mannose-6-phosphate isomerase, class I [Lacticigenium naphthae]
MSIPLFLEGVMQDKIWGGEKLKEIFGYDAPTNTIGEYWAISAHKNGESIIKNGELKGKKLSEVWKEHPNLFGNPKEKVFPLLTKILDAKNDLSVQVHPDDEYSLRVEGELGKTECWYIIDAEENAEIIYGHHAQTKEQLAKWIQSGDWDHLLRRVKVNKGDFYYVPSGTIHAIGSGVMILETQQSSDTTYRVYDYDRTDDKGIKRDLHIDKSIEVTTVPHEIPELKNEVEEYSDAKIKTFVSNSFFTVQEWSINGKHSFTSQAPYTLVSVLEGKGEIIIDDQSYEISKGTHFILPNDIKEWTISGNIQAICSMAVKVD